MDFIKFYIKCWIWIVAIVPVCVVEFMQFVLGIETNATDRLTDWLIDD